MGLLIYILTNMYVNEISMTPPRKRTQANRSADTRVALIHAAIELLHTVGFAGTTTVLIAKRAGVTTGALHHHFATKDELLFGVLDYATERLRVRLDTEQLLGPNGALQIPVLVRHLWQDYGTCEYWARWEIIIGTRSEPELHARVVAHRLHAISDVLHVWLERHIAPGEDRASVFAVFEFMLIAIRGLSLERFLDKDDAYFDRHLTILAELVGQRLEALMQHEIGR